MDLFSSPRSAARTRPSIHPPLLLRLPSVRGQCRAQISKGPGPTPTASDLYTSVATPTQRPSPSRLLSPSPRTTAASSSLQSTMLPSLHQYLTLAGLPPAAWTTSPSRDMAIPPTARCRPTCHPSLGPASARRPRRSPKPSSLSQSRSCTSPMRRAHLRLSPPPLPSPLT